MFRTLLALCCVAVFACSGISNVAKSKYQQAIAAEQQQNVPKAIELMSEAVADSPGYYEAHVKLGSYHLASDNYDEAIASLEKALSLRKGTPDLYILLGQTYLKKEMFAKAQFQFSRALDFPDAKLTDEQRFQANLGKGICKLQQRLQQDAEKYLTRAKAMRPNDVDVMFYNARLQELQMGGPNKHSQETYMAILEKAPHHLPSLARLGDMYQYLGLANKALSFYQKFLEAGGVSPEISKYVEEVEGSKEEAKKEVVMVCPVCGRYAAPGQKQCAFHGEEFVPQQ